MTHNNDPAQSADGTRGGGPGGDDELIRLEAEFAEELGGPMATFGGPISNSGVAARHDGFRGELRASFVSGAIGRDVDEAAVLGPELDGALRSVQVGAPRAEFRARALESFLAGAADAAPAEELATITPIGTPKGGGARRQARAGGRGAVQRRSGGGSGRRRPQDSGGGGGFPLRLVAGGGLLAAAAAAAFMVLQGGGSILPDGGRGPDSSGGVSPGGTSGSLVADADPGKSPSSATETPVAGPTWRVDFDAVDAEPAAILASLRLDGEVPGSVEEFAAGLAGGGRVETSSHSVRLCCEDEFVIELAAATTLDLARGEGDAFVASAGSVRVATGPGFDAEVGMVLETPHVRTEVTGTIFGVDVSADYTCVCCLEGEVHTEPVSDLLAARDMGAKSTRVIQGTPGEPDYTGPLVASHRGPLLALQGYWG